MINNEIINLFLMECRICYEGNENEGNENEGNENEGNENEGNEKEGNENELISPCFCKGSIKYVHRKCLDKWREVDVEYMKEIDVVTQEKFLFCKECRFKYIIENDENIQISLNKIKFYTFLHLLIPLTILNVIFYTIGFIIDKFMVTNNIFLTYIYGLIASIFFVGIYILMQVWNLFHGDFSHLDIDDVNIFIAFIIGFLYIILRIHNYLSYVYSEKIRHLYLNELSKKYKVKNFL